MPKNILVAGALVLASVGSVPAGAIVYSTGFENPPYTLGTINGQDGWNGCCVANTLTIENTTFKNGAQALLFTATQGTGLLRSYSPIGNLVVDVNFDLLLLSRAFPVGWGFAAFGPPNYELGGISIDEAGAVHFASANNFGQPMGTFTFDTWHNLDVLFNINAQRYDVRLDGSLIASNLAFCGTQNLCDGALTPAFSATVFDVRGSSNNLDQGGDAAFMDNLLVTAIPEPSTLTLLGVGLLFLARRRR